MNSNEMINAGYDYIDPIIALWCVGLFFVGSVLVWASMVVRDTKYETTAQEDEDYQYFHDIRTGQKAMNYPSWRKRI